MKNKIIKLVEQGISVQTLSILNENQLNALYNRLVNKSNVIEQSTPITPTKQRVEKEVVPISQLKPRASGKVPTSKGEIGLSVTSDGTKLEIMAGKEKELGEVKKKKTKGKNPWAICTSTMGKEFGTTDRSDWSKSQMKKYEKCVMGVKKSIKEGIDPYEYILEEKIMQILESSLNPKMTKRDFLNNIYSRSVTEAEEAPVKAPPKPKTPTKPGKPDTPFKPKHKPKPKAGKSDIPSWFTWDELGINLK